MILKKNKLSPQHECFLNKLKEYAIKEADTLNLLGNIYFQYHRYHEAYSYFKAELSFSERETTYQKLIKCFSELDKKVELVDILEGFIKFYYQ